MVLLTPWRLAFV